jgi:hypothetical protein
MMLSTTFHFLDHKIQVEETRDAEPMEVELSLGVASLNNNENTFC